MVILSEALLSNDTLHLISEGRIAPPQGMENVDKYLISEG